MPGAHSFALVCAILVAASGALASATCTRGKKGCCDSTSAAVAVGANQAFKAAEYDYCEVIRVGGAVVHLLWTISGRGTARENITLAAKFPSDKGLGGPRCFGVGRHAWL